FQAPNGTEEYINCLFEHALPKAITRKELLIEILNDKVFIGLKKCINGEVNDDLNDEIVIPESLYDPVIDIAHDGRQGVKKTKALLRSKVYFPGLDKVVEARLSSCYTCQIKSAAVQHEPCQTSELPSSPWQLIALHFYGSTDSGTYLLVIIDEYSRFVIIHGVNTTASHYVLPKLHESLSLFGIPQIVKTDKAHHLMELNLIIFATIMA
ncbi:unnamed protein product, partial [Didymodactylos carnosus]